MCIVQSAAPRNKSGRAGALAASSALSAFRSARRLDPGRARNPLSAGPAAASHVACASPCRRPEALSAAKSRISSPIATPPRGRAPAVAEYAERQVLDGKIRMAFGRCDPARKIGRMRFVERWHVVLILVGRKEECGLARSVAADAIGSRLRRIEIALQRMAVVAVGLLQRRRSPRRILSRAAGSASRT